MSNEVTTLTDWRKHIGVMYACRMGAHDACRNWTSYTCPRQPTRYCQCKCHLEVSDVE